MERKITIKKAGEICNCNSCGARNYEGSNATYSAHVPKVDALYEVRIGTYCSILCSDCLDELSMHIAVVRGADMLQK